MLKSIKSRILAHIAKGRPVRRIARCIGDEPYPRLDGELSLSTNGLIASWLYNRSLTHVIRNWFKLRFYEWLSK